MEEKKHIDRLYQEKFKDFEATPREDIWKNISKRLQNKDRRKAAVPLWYKLAGVAAIFAFFISYATNLLKTTSNANTSLTAKVPDEDFGVISLVSAHYSQNMLQASSILQTIMAETENLKTKEQIAAIPGSQKAGMQETIDTNVLKGIAGSSYEQKAAIASGKAEEISSDNGQGNKENISGKLRNLPVQEDAISQLRETDEKDLNSKRLRISSTAAPVYYGRFGKDSSIDPVFSNNQTSGELTMSYGINLAYQISEKIKIRSGVNKVELSHNTNNVSFTATVRPSVLSGINYKDGIPNYRIETGDAPSFGNVTASAEFNTSSLISPVSGRINQRLGFIEVPLEVEYSLVDKRIGINLIGGGSTFFLDNNEVSLSSNNFSASLGEANNLNSVSFSTNIGFGIDYDLTPAFQLNMEPVFKYQIYTFSNSTSAGNPYYFGVYSGFSFKF